VHQYPRFVGDQLVISCVVRSLACKVRAIARRAYFLRLKLLFTLFRTLVRVDHSKFNTANAG
jgi:hypothetical protein